MKNSKLVSISLLSFFLISSYVPTSFNFGYKPKGVVIIGIGSFINMGLGKVVEYFSYRIKYIVRSQGGSACGHRIVKRPGDEYQINLIPSGIMRKDTTCYLAAGMEIDLEQFLEEIEYLKKRNIMTEGRVWISAKAHIIFPYHKTLDRCMENITESTIDIGSRKGTGAAAAYKRLRIGIRIADLLDADRFKITLGENLSWTNAMLTKLFDEKPYSFDQLYKQYSAYAKQILPYVTDDLELTINKKLLSGNAVLFEGAQGSNTDISFGAYPYVSSSSTSVGGICTGAGVGPNKVSHVVGVLPAYTTALGDAPLPTEFKDITQLPDDIENQIKKLPKESQIKIKEKHQKVIASVLNNVVEKIEELYKDFISACTFLTKDHHVRDVKKFTAHAKETINIAKIEETHKATNQAFADKARYGWIDLVMVREALLLNGVDCLILSKLDALDDFDEIKICIDYKVGDKTYDYMPSIISDHKKIEPHYITLKGWKQKTSDIRQFSKLPEEARNFITTIHNLTNLPISYISVGPERDQMIVCDPLIL